MNPERQRLLDDLADEASARQRETTLLAGARLLQRKRARRAFTRSIAAVAVLAAIALWSVRLAPRASKATAVAPAPHAGVRYLTDKELLDLFPNTSVALAAVGDKKRLIFLHPEDEKKYMGNL
jgi:hypothetical protein